MEQRYINNGHGDVVQLMVSGSLIREYDYDAFGNEKNPVADDGNPFRYCAEYFDKETKTIYLRARYYDPATSRMLSEDPIGDGLNWYVYCYNNPIAFIDPSGLSGILPDGTLYLGEETAYWDEIILNLRIEYEMASEERKAEIDALFKDWEGTLTWGVDYRVPMISRPLEDYRIYDIAEKLNTLMFEAGEEWSAVFEDLLLNAGPGYPYIGSLYLTFLGFFVDYGSYDLKHLDGWKNYMHFLYDGEVMNIDGPGNILYGYLGKAMNINEQLLYIVPGLYQVLKLDSSWSYASSYFDHPEDQRLIKQGISIYTSGAIK